VSDPASALLMGGGGAVIGFLLSVLGAGGSILLLPLLVSVAGLPTREAVPLSLLVVAILAAGSAIPLLRRRLLAPRPALQLGLPALLGSWLGGSWVKAGYVPEPLQLGIFAIAALVAAVFMVRPQRQLAPPAGAVARPRQLPLGLLAQGLGLGLLTGVAGVGGGFAIVPALVLLAGLPMPMASCTSLVLIAANALVALLAQGHWPASTLPLLPPLLIGGVVGGVIGQQLLPHLGDAQLRRGFAALLLASALLTVGEALRRPWRPAVPQSFPVQADPGSPSAGARRSSLR
jgi:uncharacterized membrane protein YfcA